jgi:GlpG protein
MPDSWDYSQPRGKSRNEAHFIPLMTWAISVLCVLVTLASHTSSNAPPNSLWYELGHFGSLPAERIWSGQYLAMLTSVFLHGSPAAIGMTLMHIGFNLSWFLKIGALLEETLHPLFFAAFFISAAVVASGAELAVSGTTGVGLSGVVYAAFGLLYAGRDRFSTWRALGSRDNLKIFVVWGLICVVLTWFGTIRIANAAHFGGLIFGLAVGNLLFAPRKRPAYAVGLVGLVAMFFCSILYLPWQSRWTFHKAGQEAARKNYAAAIGWYHRSIRLGYPEHMAWAGIARVELARDHVDAAEAAVEKMQQALKRDRARQGIPEEEDVESEEPAGPMDGRAPDAGRDNAAPPADPKPSPGDGA